jgi:ribonuclease E
MPLPPSAAAVPAEAAATPAAPTSEASPPAPATDTPHAESASPNAAESPPRTRADSAEAIEPEDDADATDEGVDDDVEDDEAAPLEASVVSKRPPPLPHDAHPLPLAAVAGSIGTRGDEPLSRPIQTSQLSALTASTPVALPRSAVVAALVSLLALGAFVVYRHHSRAAANEPRIERTVQTPPVRIEEPLSAVPPPPPPPATSATPPEPAHAAPVDTAPAAPVETTPAPRTPAAEAVPPKTETVEKAPAAKPRAAAAEAPRHTPSHEPTNTGFKPGGI